VVDTALDAVQMLRNIQGMLLLVGTTGFVGSEVAGAIYGKITDQDMETDIRKVFGPKLGRIIARGGLAGIGIDIAKSAGAGDIFPTELRDIPGVAWAMVEQGGRFARDLTSRDWIRAIEDFPLMPEIGRATMAAQRERKYGATTRGGTPIVNPLTGEQETLTTGEARLKSLGIQPVLTSERFKEYEIVTKAREAMTEAKSNYVSRLAVALGKDDMDKFEKIIEEIDKRNEKAEKKERPDLMVKISVDDIKNRMKGKRLEKQLVPLLEDVQSAYGR
jgi:hypothetical protein